MDELEQAGPNTIRDATFQAYRFTAPATFEGLSLGFGDYDSQDPKPLNPKTLKLQTRNPKTLSPKPYTLNLQVVGLESTSEALARALCRFGEFDAV